MMNLFLLPNFRSKKLSLIKRHDKFLIESSWWLIMRRIETDFIFSHLLFMFLPHVDLSWFQWIFQWIVDYFSNIRFYLLLLKGEDNRPPRDGGGRDAYRRDGDYGGGQSEQRQFVSLLFNWCQFECLMNILIECAERRIRTWSRFPWQRRSTAKRPSATTGVIIKWKLICKSFKWK